MDRILSMKALSILPNPAVFPSCDATRCGQSCGDPLDLQPLTTAAREIDGARDTQDFPPACRLGLSEVLQKRSWNDRVGWARNLRSLGLTYRQYPGWAVDCVEEVIAFVVSKESARISGQADFQQKP